MASSQQHDINPEVLRLIETFSPVANTFGKDYLEYSHIQYNPPKEMDMPVFLSFISAAAISKYILELDVNWSYQKVPHGKVINEYYRQCMAGEVAY